MKGAIYDQLVMMIWSNLNYASPQANLPSYSFLGASNQWKTFYTICFKLVLVLVVFYMCLDIQTIQQSK